MSLTQLMCILWARKWMVLLVFGLILGATLLFTFMTTPVYTASTSVLIDYKGQDPVTGQFIPRDITPAYMATQAQIIQSHAVALRVIDELHLADNPKSQQNWLSATKGKGDMREWLATLLLNSLEIKPVRESNIINIEYNGPTPEFSALLAETFTQSYVDVVREFRMDPAKKNSEWFDQQLKGLRKNVETAQEKLTQYQNQNRLITGDERTDIENARLAQLSMQLIEVQGNKIDNTTRGQQLDGLKQKDELQEVQANPLVQSLKVDVLRAQTAFDTVAQSLGPNHPRYIAAFNDLKSLQAKLANEMSKASAAVNNLAVTSVKREVKYDSALATQKTKVLALRQKRDEIILMSRELETAQKVYDMALQRANQTKLESQNTQTNISILNHAVQPLTAMKPRKLLNSILGALIGLGLGMILAILREVFSRKVRAASEVEMILAAPVLLQSSLSAAPSTVGKFWKNRGKA